MAKLALINDFKLNSKHAFDSYTSLGYDYETKGIFKNCLSPEIFGNPLNDNLFEQAERLICFLINSVKRIKLHFAIALDKDSKLLN